ncbi:MAG: GNAT family N-acetyltransferase [Flavobacteriia bacterium]|nr:GNAT family N-acetyltransferase [Flavobacteriia bacterium]
MSLSFEQIKPNELAVVLDYLRSAATTLQQKGVAQWTVWLNPPQSNIEWVEKGIQEGEYYLILQEKSPIGIVRLSETDETYWGKQSSEARYIHSLVIDERFSGLGLGKQVIELMIQQAISDNIPFMRLDCIATNTALCNYYESQGFKKVGQKQMPHSLNNLYEKALIN